MKSNNYIEKARLFNIKGLTALALATSLLSACVKNDDLVSPQEGTIYMPQAYQNKSVMTLYKMDDPQKVTFGAYYAGFNGAPSDITVKFEVDPAYVDWYNELNSHLSYRYHLFPDSTYNLTGLETVIKAGKKTSEPLAIEIEGKKLQFGYKYMLPIRIVSVSDGTTDSSLSVTYFRLDTLLTRVKDFTSEATLTVSDENRNGAGSAEGSPKLVDGSVDTKFLSFNYHSEFWMQLSFSEPKFIDAYDMTSANDAVERDPRDWQLLGSNDGTNWTVLDTRIDEAFPDRKFTRRFNIENPGSYRHYRLKVTRNMGAKLFQMAEWRLLQFY